jgi:hypothetical protein
LARDTGLAALERIVFGFLCEPAILRIHGPADLAADNAADNGTKRRSSDPARSSADLIAEDTAGHRSDHHARIGLARTIGSATGKPN